MMEIGLAWCGGSSARGFKVRVLRWRSLRCGCSGVVERSEISEHSEHSEGLADARSFSRCSALRKQRGAYGCHLPARGGPPTCAGLLLAWWGVGDAVDWHFLWDIVGAVCEGSAALEVFVDYVLRGVVHVFVIYRANRLFCLQR